MLEIQQTLADHGIKSELKGQGLLILCPFHDDHNPSLQVFSNGFKCYACNVSGNLNTLFVELGIETAPKPDLLKSMTNRLLRNVSNNLHCLVGLPDAKPFKADYRGIKSYIYLANKAFSLEDDTTCFPLYDLDFKYRGYIKNTYGKKYDNIFTNGYVPFNLQNLSSNAPIIVEGIFDALSVQQLGYKNVIALLGTGNIWSVFRILKQIKAHNVHILFDSDESGEYAAKKLSDLYRSSKILTIPEKNQDPNSYDQLKELMETEYEISA